MRAVAPPAEHVAAALQMPAPSEGDPVDLRGIAAGAEFPHALLEQVLPASGCARPGTDWGLRQGLQPIADFSGRRLELALLQQRRTQRTELCIEDAENGLVRRQVALHRSDHGELRFEELGDETVQRAVGEHVLHRDALGLAEAVGTILGLAVIGGHPVEVLEDEVGAGRQRQADALPDPLVDRPMLGPVQGDAHLGKLGEEGGVVGAARVGSCPEYGRRFS